MNMGEKVLRSHAKILCKVHHRSSQTKALIECDVFLKQNSVKNLYPRDPITMEHKYYAFRR